MSCYHPPFESKIIQPVHIVLMNLSKPVVFTNGCFDILHRGHVTYLAEAKTKGNTLIVALNTDSSVKRLGKQYNRPINCLEDRMALIASLVDVDYVTFFDDDTPLNLIKMINPNVLVKGGDWPLESIVGYEEVIKNNGKVYSIPFVYNMSTTKIIHKMCNNE